MTLIQGTCEYTTPRPFESASARVSLSFAFVEGIDENEQIAKVAQLAEQHAKAMIDAKVDIFEKLRTPVSEAQLNKELAAFDRAAQPAVVIGKVPAGTDGGAVLNALGLPGTPPSPTVAAAPQEVAALVPSPASTVANLPGQPSAPMATTQSAPIPSSPATMPGAPATTVAAVPLPGSGAPMPVAHMSAASISDTDLVTAITHRNAALIPVYGDGSAQKICELVAEFVAPPAKAYAIPQAQRQAFLDRLAALA